MKFQDNQHFCHHHFLEELSLAEGKVINCGACEEIITEPFHGCLKCSYYVHDNCLNQTRSLQHSSHPFHPLTLMPAPTYSTQNYTCNACGSAGRAFSYSCAHCEFDLHIQCSSLPQKVLIDKHPHELKLTFDCPLEENTMKLCDICRWVVDTHYWLYHCADGCDFDAHLDCVALEEKPKEDKDRDAEDETENPKEDAKDNPAGKSLESRLLDNMNMLEAQLEVESQLQMMRMTAQSLRSSIRGANLSGPKYRYYTSHNNFHY